MYKKTYILNPLVSENEFIKQKPEEVALPKFEDIKDKLPQVHWQGHESHIDCYWKAWKIAFSNLKQPTSENGFIKNFIDTAYNGNIFMWDTSFMMMFGIYGRRAFDFQSTLDNFYAKQHPDGFICREISAETGQDLFHRYDLVSTGPNLFPWAEWIYFQHTSDVSRLEKVFPVLVAYHKWLKEYRTWKDGSYFSSGWGTGMDNQPRLEAGYNQNFSHGHMSWLDTNLQQILSGKILMAIGEVIERWQEIEDIIDETEALEKFVNEQMYDPKTKFYYDKLKDGSLNTAKSIGAFWGLEAEIYPENRVKDMCQYLNDDKYFKRTHMVPSLSYDNDKYNDLGRYWQGGVWAPTNYMLLKGLEKYNEHSLAFDIALNHNANVVKVFEDTGTLWENYAPEKIVPAKPAKPDFVGWTGLSAINVLIENVFGIQPDVPSNEIHWHINLKDEKFGVANYPFGESNTLKLSCDSSIIEEDGFPKLDIEAEESVTINIYFENNKKTIKI